MRVTVRTADFLPHVTAVQFLLEVENRIAWRTVSSFVELEQLFVLIWKPITGKVTLTISTSFHSIYAIQEPQPKPTL